MDDPFKIGRNSLSFGELNPGWYRARVVGMIYLGTQTMSYENRTSKARQFCFVLEFLPHASDRHKWHEPILYSIAVNIDPSARSRLTKMMTAFRAMPATDGEMIDIAKILGKTASIYIERNAKQFNAIGRIDVAAASPDGDGWKVEPFKLDPLQMSQAREWQEVYEELASLPHCPQLFGSNIADVVAASDELGYQHGGWIGSSQPSSPKDDDQGTPF